MAKILGISDITVKQHLSYLEDAYLIKILPKFSEKSKEQINEKMKIYLLDPVLKKPFHSRTFDDKARDVENLILKNLPFNQQKFYLQKDSEIDFLVRNAGKTQLINSYYSSKINEREYAGFSEQKYRFKNPEKLIISRNIYQEKPILTVPLWAWLLFS